MSQLTSCHPNPSRSHPPTNTQYCSVTPDSTHKHFWCCDIVISCITWMPKNGECRHAILCIVQSAVLEHGWWKPVHCTVYSNCRNYALCIMQRPLMKSVAYLRKNHSCVLWDIFWCLFCLSLLNLGVYWCPRKMVFQLAKNNSHLPVLCEEFLGVAYLR